MLFLIHLLPGINSKICKYVTISCILNTTSYIALMLYFECSFNSSLCTAFWPLVHLSSTHRHCTGIFTFMELMHMTPVRLFSSKSLVTQAQVDIPSRTRMILSSSTITHSLHSIPSAIYRLLSFLSCIASLKHPTGKMNTWRLACHSLCSVVRLPILHPC